MFQDLQKTIKDSIQLEGVGLHSGVKSKLCLKPAEVNSGIKFKRTDVDNTKNIIEASYKNVSSPVLCTKIKNSHGVSVSTIEHLMAAFYLEGIDNVLVEIDASEVPIMDGSAFDFVEAIRLVGTQEQNYSKKFIKVLKKVEVKDGPKYISIDKTKVSLDIDFEIKYSNSFIGTQRNRINVYEHDLKDIYNSRTFCLYEDVEKLRQIGLAKGGSLDNAIVVKNNADLGIAFDGDGDRSIFCDNKGMLLSGDKSALLLSNYLLKKNPNSKVVTCMNSGNSIDGIVTQTNSTVIRTKVGSIEVSRKMITENALLGFEENGGFMFGKHNYVRDGGMTLALFLELLASSNKSMSEELTTLPSSFTTKDKISCKKEDGDKIISKLLAEFPSADTTDGIKIIFDKKNWVMVRPSGTEPIIRIYAESDSEKNLETLMKEYTQKIKSFLHR